MPIQIGNTILRNIQEQVGKNQADINALKLAQTLGWKNIGTLDSAEDIPEGSYNYGEYYLIGTQAPFEVYLFTNHDGTDEFINLGTLQGPQGNNGLQGNTGTVEVVQTVTLDPGSNASVENTGTAQAAKLIFKIPTGAAGPQGPIGSKGEKGDTGLTGETGPQGIPGDPGQSFMIIGNITSEAQLPDPTTTPRNYAYIYNDGDASTPNRIYYITGTEGNEAWEYSSFAAAGTTITVNGNPVYSWNADSKVDKVTTATTNPQAYIKNADGTPGMIAFGQYVSAGIVQRDNSNQIIVPATPTANSHATSKQYVDANVVNKEKVKFNQLVNNKYINYTFPSSYTVLTQHNFVAGHKMYVRFDTTTATTYQLRFRNADNSGQQTFFQDSGKCDRIVEVDSNYTYVDYAIYAFASGIQAKALLIDLTVMFGSGSEPDLATCQALFSADYIYTQGTNMQAIYKGTTPIVLVDTPLQEPVLLWSNPNPDSTYDNGGTGNTNILDYKYIILGYKAAYGSNVGIQYIKALVDSSVNSNLTIATDRAARSISINEYGNIGFAACYDSIASTYVTTALIPIEIYGSNTL